MPPKYKKKDYLIILVNTGYTDETEDENETSFLEKSKQLMNLLIQRRIFLRPKDEVGVIIMGAFKTKNRLSYDNIMEMSPLQIPTWDLVEEITRLRGTKESANWVDGMNLVLEYIKTECIEGNSSRTVVLLTDFKEDSDVIKQYDVDTIAADIKAQEINLLAIGDKAINGDSQIELSPSEEVFANVCKMVQGQVMTFEDTTPMLMIYKDQSKTPMPWKVDMDLFDIEIPVVMYLKTTEDFKLPRWQLFTDTKTTKVPVERCHTLVDKNREVIGEDEIITGNMYGRKFIPFSDEDKAALKYESGPKGFMIFGFTKREFITLDCLAGKGSYIVVPGQQWASPFYSLVKAMADKNRVAIVRRVFRANVAPKMGVLIPKIDVPGEPWCLIYIELVFAEDRRIVQKKPIKSAMDALSSCQENAIDDLIDSMMLMEVEDNATKEKKEAFKAGTVPDVSRQHVWDKLTYRALYPDAPVPLVSDFLKKILEPPKSVKYKSKPVLRLIYELFPISRVWKKEKRVRNYRRYKAKVTKLEAHHDGFEQITDGIANTRVESNTQDTETQSEELPQIEGSVEAAQEIEIDLDELVQNM